MQTKLAVFLKNAEHLNKMSKSIKKVMKKIQFPDETKETGIIKEEYRELQELE